MNESIKKLSSAGLNLFAACPVFSAPEEVLKYLREHQIPFSEEDNLCVAAHGGKDLWSKLPHPLDSAAHPIDTYSANIAAEFFPDARILFPDTGNQRSHFPLQRLGRALNISRQSRLGIDINSEFGLWFAFRSVFLTRKKIPQIILKVFDSPCEACKDKPCLKETDFSQARLACPFKSEHRYTDEQLLYHLNQSSNVIQSTKK